MWSLLALAHFAGAVFMAWLANWVGLIPWRRAAMRHWTERARQLWPVRVTAGTNILLIPLILDQGHRLFSPETATGWIVSGLASCLGTLIGTYPFDHEVFPQLQFRNWLGQITALWGLRLGMWIAFIAATVLMPADLGWETLVIGGGYLAFHFAAQWGLLVRFLRRVRFAKPANEKLRRIVDEVSRSSGITVPAAWLIGGVQAQAFALPTTRDLLFSERLLEICSDEEISVICAHEIAHLRESKATLAGRLLGSLSLFPLTFAIPVYQTFRYGVVALPLLTLLISRFARWLSHRMEKRADQSAAATQINEGVYARALEKIYRENQLPAVNINNRQTHPHLYDRMLAAGITPDYPRPARPKKTTWVGTAYVVVLGVIFALVAMRGAVRAE